MNTKHYSNDRAKRERIIQNIGEGEYFADFIVDRGHKEGAELHVLTTNGIIKIYNLFSKKLVTKLIARPNQIKRYYTNGNYPEDILAVALKHKKMRLNCV